MALTIPMAQLLGVFLESLAHGLYVMIFKECMSVLRKRHSRPSNHLVGTAVSLFILTTAHLIIDILRNVQAFASHMAEPNYPSKYYSTYGNWTDILKSVLYVAVTLVSDAFILHRLHIVWDRNYFITTLPILLFFADIAISIFWVYTLTLVNPGDDVYASVLSFRVKAFYLVTLTLNVICTSLIAYKILAIQREVVPFKADGKDPLSRAVTIIVESCALYSASLIVMITTFASGSPAVFIVLNFMCPIIGIVFSSVIVRVGLGVSHGDSYSTEQDNASTRNGWNIASYNNRQNNSVSTPGRGVQVLLQHTMLTEVDEFPDITTNHASITLSKLDSASICTA